MSLFRIHNSDGDVYVEMVAPQEIFEDIEETKDGAEKYLASIPANGDTNYWPEGSVLLIEGKIVTPKPKKTVTVESWEIK